ncbi:hypothetical protein PR048_009119 [Dryococelus australis]|uniref:Uncharacterized protein n=1 Tax=Dryococelus australis TaxID=614101 RepID=A0ABQ9HZ01_9NEOP|nr:hypothetical protein PR048_009119 [Dryococelus australis]
MKIRPVKRKRSGAAKHKTASYQHSITCSGKETVVCKQALVALYNIGMKKVDLIQKSIKSGLPAPLPDTSGRHNTRPNKTPKNVADYIIQHISSLPAEESHYSRNCNIHKKYISHLLSVALTHKLCIEKCNAEELKYALTAIYTKSDTRKTCNSGAASEQLLRLRKQTGKSPEIQQVLFL